MSDTIVMSDSDDDKYNNGSDDEKFVYRVRNSFWRTNARGLVDPEQARAHPLRIADPRFPCPECGKEMLKKSLKRHLTLHCKGKKSEVIIQ
jgi:hypothetical protein